MDLKQRNFVKENTIFTAIKTTAKNKNLSQIYIIRRLLSCLRYDPKSLKVYGYDAQAKTNVFLPTDTAI